jgi:dolichol-phosphate mannosyltransferase
MGKLLKEASRELSNCSKSFEIVIIDDSSTDGTLGKIRGFKKRSRKANLRLVIRKERGIGGALKRGLREAKGKFVIIMDADYSHDPRDLPRFAKALRGCDCVIGSRFLPGGGLEIPLHRQFMSRTANLFASIVLGTGLTEHTTSYRAFKKSLLEGVDLDKEISNGYSAFVELLWLLKKKGAKFREIPIVFGKRLSGESKLSTVTESIKWMGKVVRLRVKG